MFVGTLLLVRAALSVEPSPVGDPVNAGSQTPMPTDQVAELVGATSDAESRTVVGWSAARAFVSGDDGATFSLLERVDEGRTIWGAAVDRDGGIFLASGPRDHHSLSSAPEPQLISFGPRSGRRGDRLDRPHRLGQPVGTLPLGAQASAVSNSGRRATARLPPFSSIPEFRAARPASVGSCRAEMATSWRRLLTRRAARLC